MPKIIFALCIIFFSLNSWSQAEPTTDAPKAFFKVDDGVYRGARPATPEEFQYLQNLGIKTIINVQGSVPLLFKPFLPGESQAEILEEGVEVQSLGMGYFNIPMRAFKKLTPENEQEIRKIVEMMDDPSLQPVYLHCHMGADRTGVLVAMYRLLYQNCSFAQVQKEVSMDGKPWTKLFTLPMRDLLKRASEEPPTNQRSCPLESLL